MAEGKAKPDASYGLPCKMRDGPATPDTVPQIPMLNGTYPNL